MGPTGSKKDVEAPMILEWKDPHEPTASMNDSLHSFSCMADSARGY
jgi:hypothetical protein